MRNDHQDDNSQCGMPLGLPLYRNSRVRYRLDMVNYTVAIKHPEVIAGLTPEPLTYDDARLLLALTSGTELLEGFGEDDAPWDEVVIKWQVMFRGEDGHYNLAQFINGMSVAISAREVFGQPKIPARVAVERRDGNLSARLSSVDGRRELMSLAFSPDGRPGTGERPPFQVPRMINLKQIPSAVAGNAPEVKQLVTMNYGRPVIHKVLPGRGEIQLLAHAPAFLLEAGLGEVESAFYVDIELDVTGGHILYDYLRGD